MDWFSINFQTKESNEKFLRFGVDKSVYPKWSELSKSAWTMLNEPNAGGSSEISEALSFEFFYRKCNSVLLKVQHVA